MDRALRERGCRRRTQTFPSAWELPLSEDGRASCGPNSDESLGREALERGALLLSLRTLQRESYQLAVAQAKDLVVELQPSRQEPSDLRRAACFAHRLDRPLVERQVVEAP